MSTSYLTRIEEVVSKPEIPKGEYPGTWGGYIVLFRVGDKQYRGHTDVGVRGINIPCIVSVNGHETTVTVKKEG